MRYIASIIVGLLLPFSFATAAEATRPVSGFAFSDQCPNIKGVQPIHQTINGPFKVKANGKCKRL